MEVSLSLGVPSGHFIQVCSRGPAVKHPFSFFLTYFKFVLFSINEHISYTHTLFFCFRTNILWCAFQVSPQRPATLCRCMGALSFMEAHTESENTVPRQLFSRETPLFQWDEGMDRPAFLSGSVFMFTTL